MSAYEAYCPSCRVSHPPGTRRCVHCGGDVLRERPDDAVGLRAAPPPDLEDLLAGDSETVEDEGEESVRKAPGGVRVAISLLWIALAIGISVYRSCQGG